jgi:Tfp pilus assembly pilus retraction ATPase PilT
VLDNKERWGNRAFFFVRDPRCQDAASATVDVELTEDAERDLAELLDRVNRSGLKVVQDYRSAQDAADAWLSDLASIVEKEHPLPADHAYEPSLIEGWRARSFLEQLEDTAHNGALETRLVRHVPAAATARAVEKMREHIAEQGSTPLFVTGPPGCGKATAIAVLLDTLRRSAGRAAEQDADPLLAFFSTRAVRASPPPSRTDWTRLVPPSVLTGHVSSLLP